METSRRPRIGATTYLSDVSLNTTIDPAFTAAGTVDSLAVAPALVGTDLISYDAPVGMLLVAHAVGGDITLREWVPHHRTQWRNPNGGGAVAVTPGALAAVVSKTVRGTGGGGTLPAPHPPTRIKRPKRNERPDRSGRPVRTGRVVALSSI